METRLFQDRVRQNLELFYHQRAERLRLLTLDDVLASAPHNLWSTEDASAPGILEQLIEEYLASFEKWWDALIRDADFCLQAIQQRSQITMPRYGYQHQLASALNRLTLDFVNRYCRPDYAIDWEKPLRFNSGAD